MALLVDVVERLCPCDRQLACSIPVHLESGTVFDQQYIYLPIEQVHAIIDAYDTQWLDPICDF